MPAGSRFVEFRLDPASRVKVDFAVKEWLGWWFLALVPRLLYNLQLFFSDPLYHIPTGDAITYVNHGLAFKSGIWLIHSDVFHKSPFYTYFLGGVFWLFGRDFTAVRIIQAALDAASCVLLFQISLRLYHNYRVGLITFILACFYAPLLVYTGQLLPTTWAVFFELLLLWKLTGAALKESPPRRFPIFYLGILLGLLVIARANFLLALPLLAWWLVFKTAGPDGFKPRLIRGTVFLLGLFLVILPVTVRNYYVSGDYVLINDLGGINFFIGNDPGYPPYIGGWLPSPTWNRIYNTPFKLGIAKASRRTSFYYRAALKSFWKYPLAHVRRLLEKIRLFFSSYEIANNCNLHRLRKHSSLLRFLSPQVGFFYFPYGLVVSLFFIGCFYYREKETVPLYLLWTAGFLTCVLFFNTSRYRLPGAVLMLLPAAASLKALKLKRGFVIILIGAAILFNLTPPKDLHPYPEDHYLATDKLAQHQYPEALNRFLRNLDRHPDKIRGYQSLGEFYLSRNNLRKAEEIFRKIPEKTDNPDWLFFSYVALATIYKRQGRIKPGLYKKIVELNPDQAFYKGQPYFQMGSGRPSIAYFIRNIN
ncbi:MAG: glycosyltransferase family 39 protein [bacterium]